MYRGDICVETFLRSATLREKYFYPNRPIVCVAALCGSIDGITVDTPMKH